MSILRFVFLFLISVGFLGAENFAQSRMPGFDVSGENGRDGRDGRDAPQTSPRTPGRDGRDGRDASRPTRGENAGDLRIRIFQTAEDMGNRTFKIEGSYTDPRTGGELNIPRQTLSLDLHGRIQLVNRGGNGGNAGRAGRGQPGSDGENGRHAVVLQWDPLKGGWGSFRFTAPQRGQRGGDGGNAGETYDGADAGDGGNQIIEVPEGQAYLLELIGFNPANLAGGQGGRAGLPVTSRQVARGGEGGRGGNGITKLKVRLEYKLDSIPKNKPQEKDIPLRSYRRTETVSWKVWEEKRDEDGFPIEPPRYFRDTHRAEYDMPAIVPDAANGRDGEDGRPSRVQNLRNGRDGRAGKQEIHLIDGAGNTKAVYAKPPELVITQMTIDQQRPDGALMPFEEGSIRLRVTNTGGMPSDHGVLELQVADDSSLLDFDSASFSLPRLEPGESSEVFSVPFTVNETSFGQVSDRNLRARVTTTSSSNLSVVPIGRYADSRRINVDVELPVSVTSIQGLNRLRSGEAAKFSFQVENLSSMPVEEKALLKALLRYVEGSLPGDAVVLVDENNRRVDLVESGLSLELGELAAHSSRIIELKLGIPRDRQPNEQFTLRPGLQVSMTGNEDQASSVENQDFVLMVGHSFQLTEESDFIVVGSGEGGYRDQVVRSIENQLGLRSDIFDLGVEGVFHLLDDDPNTVRDLFKDKVILLVIPSSDRNFYQSIEVEALRELIESEASSVIVSKEGDNPASAINRLTEIIETRTRSESPAQSTEELVERLQSNPVEEVGQSEGYEPHKRLFWPWSRPQPKHWDQRMQEAILAVSGNVPNRQFDIVGDFDPGKGRGGFLWFGRKYPLGSSQVARVLDQSNTQAVSTGAHPDSEEFAFVSYLSLKAKRKLNLYFEALDIETGSSEDQLTLLQLALLFELAYELRGVSRVENASADDIEELQLLHEFMIYDFKFLEDHQTKLKSLGYLFGVILSSVRGRSEELEGYVQKELDEFADANFEQDAQPEFKRIVLEAANDLERRAAEEKRLVTDIVTSEIAGEVMRRSSTSGRSAGWQNYSDAELDARLEYLQEQAKRYAERKAEFEKRRNQHLLPGGRDGCRRLLEDAAKPKTEGS